MSIIQIATGATQPYTHLQVRRITLLDLLDAIRKGLADFREKPSHYVFMCLLYPIAGIALTIATSSTNFLALLFPLMSGFALIGPIAALGLYEISRRREAGLEASWLDAVAVTRAASFPSIAVGAVLLTGIFVVWLVVAQTLYMHLFDDAFPTSLATLLSNIMTAQGIELIVIGHALGFVFALVVLATTVVTFPALLDKNVGLISAVSASVRAFAANPLPVLTWGFLVALALIVGTLTVFVGLAVIIPVLGHTSWHLYRKLVVG